MPKGFTNLERQICHRCHHGCFGWWAQKTSHIDFCSSVCPSGVHTRRTDWSFFVFSPFSPWHRLVVPKTYFCSWPNVDKSVSKYFYWSEHGSGDFSALASVTIKPSEPSVSRIGISSGHWRERQNIHTCSVPGITVNYFAVRKTQNQSESLSETKHTKMRKVRISVCYSYLWPSASKFFMHWHFKSRNFKMRFSLLLLWDEHFASLSWSWVARAVKVLVLRIFFQNAGLWSAWNILWETTFFNNLVARLKTSYSLTFSFAAVPL